MLPYGQQNQLDQHFISGSGLDNRALMRQLACDADGLLGGDPNTALLIDETCFAKQGKHSVGVQRQWNGNLGKVDNCQCGVFTALACQRRACLLDFDLYLPEEWTADGERCRKAKVPAHRRAFQTKIELALGMVKRAGILNTATVGKLFLYLKHIYQSKIKRMRT